MKSLKIEGEGYKIFMAAVFAFDTGKAVVQIDRNRNNDRLPAQHIAARIRTEVKNAHHRSLSQPNGSITYKAIAAICESG